MKYLVEHALEGLHWLEEMGVEYEPTVYTIVGALWPRSHGVARGGRGAAIVKEGSSLLLALTHSFKNFRHLDF